jgi:hypothetical protein
MWLLVKALPDNKLVLRSNLYVIAGFELPIFHMIFFHSHKGRIRVCLAKAVPIPKLCLLLFVLGETRKEVKGAILQSFL